MEQGSDVQTHLDKRLKIYYKTSQDKTGLVKKMKE